MQEQKLAKIIKGIVGDLLIMANADIKPNFSAVARKYGIDRATVKKYYEAGGITIKEPIKKESKYDKYKDLIEEKMADPLVKISALYQYMCNKYGDEINFTYSGLKAYVERNDLRNKTSNITPHVLYETAPGEQLQVDWKESLRIETVNGEIIEFNIFSATLGYSRFHQFIFSFGKGEDDFLRCLIEVLRRLGGKPKKIKTDNMTAIVSITGSNRKKHPRILQFEKDLGTSINLCDVRSPETKGKCEVSNKFMDWLFPYNKEIKDVNHLIEMIDVINKQCNNQINDRTHLPPITLFKEEKEYLDPLPSSILLNSYISNIEKCEVKDTLLVSYNGNKYSVPSKYIGKKVTLTSSANKLYIYFNTELIACHEITNNDINYDLNHYSEGLCKRLKTNNNDDIIEMAKNNLNRLSKLGGKK